MHTSLITGTTQADLIAIPAIMLGFHPHDSCVVLALDGPAVRFCARVDLDWFAIGFDTISEQILSASSNVGAQDFILIGFGDEDLACIAVEQMIAVVSVERVLEALVVTDGQGRSILGKTQPSGYRFDTSSVAAQAVYNGVNVAADRATALQPITQANPPADHVVLSAERAVAQLGSTSAMELTASLATAEALSTPDALLLAILLGEEDRFTAVLTSLNTATADQYWDRLVQARAVCPPQYEPNTLALLAVASWLSGRGAAQSSCLEQLATRTPRHPILGLLHRLHRLGVPPMHWDR